jgi:hypothetical protein
MFDRTFDYKRPRHVHARYQQKAHGMALAADSCWFRDRHRRSCIPTTDDNERA